MIRNGRPRLHRIPETDTSSDNSDNEQSIITLGNSVASSTSDLCESLDDPEEPPTSSNQPHSNLLKHLFNRELNGRFARHSRAKTEKIYPSIPERNWFNLSEIVTSTDDLMGHIFMGFTQCGRFLLSYSIIEDVGPGLVFFVNGYMLHIWNFVPKKPAKIIAEHRIFRHSKTMEVLDVTICQWPLDLERLVIYGTCQNNRTEAYLTIVTLPSMQRCKDCHLKTFINSNDTAFLPRTTSQCLKHGVTVDAMLSVTPPYPVFNPKISLSYPDYIILNTGHFLYALNISCNNNEEEEPSTDLSNSSIHDSEFANPPTPASSLESNDLAFRIAGPMPVSNDLDNEGSIPEYSGSQTGSITIEDATNPPTPASQAISDCVSDISESVSMKHDMLETINHLDTSDSETECSECSKPFHELNITCDPLHVTGRSYWTHPSVLDSTTPTTATSRMKILIHKRDEKKLPLEKIAEKAYEFTEETEKCEKLSLFRKKRLADKKYAFSEDNCENIVPFNKLRHERRFFSKPIRTGYRNISNRLNMSPDRGPFLSPRSNSGIINSPRSPILSPTSRIGPFSPSNSRHLCNRLISLSPTSRKSSISPRGDLSNNKKYDVYSPSHIDSDDNECKIVLRQINNVITMPKVELSDNLVNKSMEKFTPGASNVISNNSNLLGHMNGLLIADELAQSMINREKEPMNWIGQVVRRYSSVDFDSTSSMVSGTEHDIQVELPVLVHTNLCGEEHHLNAVPSHVSNNVVGPTIAIIHRTFDAEQFCHRMAKRLCSEHGLKFAFCTDYDIEILDVCPLSGDVICSAYIEINASKRWQSPSAPRVYSLRFMFLWGAGHPGGNHCVILNKKSPPVLHESRVPGMSNVAEMTELNKTSVTSSNSYLDVYYDRSNMAEMTGLSKTSMTSCLDVSQIEKPYCRPMKVLIHDSSVSLTSLKDEENFIGIVLDENQSEDFPLPFYYP